VGDAMNYMEYQLDLILSQAAIPSKKHDRLDSYERYLRLWKAMELVRNGPVEHHQLVRSVYSQHAYEIDRLVAARLLTFVSGSYAQYGMSLQELDTVHDHNHGMGDEGSCPAPGCSLPDLLNQPLSSRYVGAASPLMRVAFNMVLDDPAMVARTEWVRAQAQLQYLEWRQREVTESRDTSMRDRASLLQDYENLVEKREALQGQLGEDKMTNLLDDVLKLHTREVDRVVSLTDLRDELERQRDELLTVSPVGSATPEAR
jgi:hypothetical protein